MLVGSLFYPPEFVRLHPIARRLLLSSGGSMVGLEFWVRFRRPVYADETISMEWLVVKVTANEKLKGDIVELRGRIKAQDGQTALGAKGRVLVTDRL